MRFSYPIVVVVVMCTLSLFVSFSVITDIGKSSMARTPPESSHLEEETDKYGPRHPAAGILSPGEPPRAGTIDVPSNPLKTAHNSASIDSSLFGGSSTSPRHESIPSMAPTPPPPRQNALLINDSSDRNGVPKDSHLTARKKVEDRERPEVIDILKSKEPHLHVKIKGRLGNQLFQWSSASGIAVKNGMKACFTHNPGKNDVGIHFEGVDLGCTTRTHGRHVHENGRYGTYNSFSFEGESVLDGYLQSYKYFDPNLRETFGFKPAIIAEAASFLAPFEKMVKVGIHVRYTHQTEVDYLRFPPERYFENVLSYFRSKYKNVHFVVASDDVSWCSEQSFFQSADVCIVKKKNIPVLDMAILAACDHMVITAGSFGWWAAYLGADAKDGEVIYYDSEFVMEHQINKGNVVREDFYPGSWMAMGASEQGEIGQHEQTAGMHKGSLSVVVLVLSKRDSFATRNVIRETWASKHDNVFFVIGDACPIPLSSRKEWSCEGKDGEIEAKDPAEDKDVENNLIEEEKQYLDIIRVADKDVYRNLPGKLKSAYSWVIKNTSADWIVKTDDDSFVRIDTMERYLATKYSAKIGGKTRQDKKQRHQQAKRQSK